MNSFNSFGSTQNNFSFNTQQNPGFASPSLQAKPVGFSSPIVSQNLVFGNPNSGNTMFNSTPSFGSNIGATGSPQVGSIFGNAKPSTFGSTTFTAPSTLSTSTAFSLINSQPHQQQSIFGNTNLAPVNQTDNLFNSSNTTAGAFPFSSPSVQNPVATTPKSFSFGTPTTVALGSGGVTFGTGFGSATTAGTGTTTTLGSSFSFPGPTSTIVPAVVTNSTHSSGFSFPSLQSNVASSVGQSLAPVAFGSPSNSASSIGQSSTSGLFGPTSSSGLQLQSGSFLSSLTTTTTAIKPLSTFSLSSFPSSANSTTSQPSLLLSSASSTTTSMTTITGGAGAMGTTITSTTSPFSLSLNVSTAPSTTGAILGSTGFGLGGTSITNSSSSGLSSIIKQPATASPLATSSISSKKGLGGSPISDLTKSVLVKDSAQKINSTTSAITNGNSVVATNGTVATSNLIKDSELQPELKEIVEAFKKYVTEQKMLREDVLKSNEVANLIVRVDEESQILKQSISDVANGLQRIELQNNKLKNDIAKEESSIKTAQISSDASLYMTMDRGDCSQAYFTNKVRELETRAGLFLQEIELVESMLSAAAVTSSSSSCGGSSQNGRAAMSSRDLVDIMRKVDDEFIGLAAKLYGVHERVKIAKAEFLRRRSRQAPMSLSPLSSSISNNNSNSHHHQQLMNPFLSIEGRFGDTFESPSSDRWKSSRQSSSFIMGNHGNSRVGNFKWAMMNSSASPSSTNAATTKAPTARNKNENLGGSPFENNCYYVNNNHNIGNISQGARSMGPTNFLSSNSPSSSFYALPGTIGNGPNVGVGGTAAGIGLGLGAGGVGGSLTSSPSLFGSAGVNSNNTGIAGGPFPINSNNAVGTTTGTSNNTFLADSVSNKKRR